MNTGHHHVLLAGRTYREIDRLLPLGRLLAGAEPAALKLLGLVRVRPARSLSTGALAARSLRQRLELLARDTGAEHQVAVTHAPWQELGAAAGTKTGTLAVLDWHTATREPPEALACDLAVARGSLPARVQRILLPVRGGLYAGLALQLALAIAEARHAEITLLHATPPHQRIAPWYQSFLSHLRARPEVTRWVNVQSPDVVGAIRREAAHHQLLIMGAAATPEPSVVGPVAAQVAASLPIPLIVVKSGRAMPAAEGTLPPLDYTIPVIVDKWFAENSYHAGEFADLRQLAALKSQQGLTISVGLPALNEEQTIGPIICQIQQALMRDVPLIDELVLIDSQSTDRTAEIAASLGVPVHRHADLLPAQGTHCGKGEALWKSLSVLRGDLVAWVDTDIENFDPRFVYGVLGPLLRNPRLKYVKGYYQRPLKSGEQLVEGAGGRVTELVARPLLNLFFPELSGLVQPLSGEYAGRREALRQVPFFTGYGVEIGLLIDMLQKFGLDAIGQVDLEERVHHSQTLDALSRMAFALIQVVMQRVGDQHQIALMEAMNQSLKQIRQGDGQFALEVKDIRDVERPPMDSLPGG